MGDLLLLLTYIGVGVGSFKLYKYIKLKKSQLDVVRFDQEVSDLMLKRDRAMTLHRLLTDINICDKKNENYKVFNLSWKSEMDGQIYAYDIYITDKKSANANALTELANIELTNLAPDIKTGIYKLKLRSKLVGAEFKTEEEYTLEKPTRDIETLGDDTKVYF